MRAEADPNLIVYFAGEFMPLCEARVGILTHTLHYGTGVFEGIRGHWDDASQQLYVLRAPEHYERWKQNCGILHIEIPASTETLCAITLELMRRNDFRTNVYVRPLAYKSAERVGVAPDEQDAFAIVALPFGDYLHAEKGLHAGVSAWRRVEDNAIPARAKICGAYVNSALASDDARRCGFDEAIMLDEDGHVAEGATCNLFMVRRGALITPPVYGNVLEGITRDTVMQLAEHELGVRAVERPIDRSELYVCDELFFTGTAVGIAPVVQVDHRPVKEGAIGSMTRAIQMLYVDATHGRLDQYRTWLMSVYEPHDGAETKAELPAEQTIG